LTSPARAADAWEPSEKVIAPLRLNVELSTIFLEVARIAPPYWVKDHTPSSAKLDVGKRKTISIGKKGNVQLYCHNGELTENTA